MHSGQFFWIIKKNCRSSSIFTESKKELSLLLTFLYTKVLIMLTKDILTINNWKQKELSTLTLFSNIFSFAQIVFKLSKFLHMDPKF